jgi:hypothetical protein
MNKEEKKNNERENVIEEELINGEDIENKKKFENVLITIGKLIDEKNKKENEINIDIKQNKENNEKNKLINKIFLNVDKKIDYKKKKNEKKFNEKKFKEKKNEKKFNSTPVLSQDIKISQKKKKKEKLKIEKKNFKKNVQCLKKQNNDLKKFESFLDTNLPTKIEKIDSNPKHFFNDLDNFFNNGNLEINDKNKQNNKEYINISNLINDKDFDFLI